ncbi:MAG: hypothetical protein K0B02_01325 [DPANN group archaeon]|nr:hypothetical protein [DPANN group archaeon]
MNLINFVKYCIEQAKEEFSIWTYDTTLISKVVQIVGFIASMFIFYYLFM